MQQAYAAGTGETESAKAADAAKASEVPIADKHPPPPPKKKRLEQGQGSKATNIEVNTLAEILLTLVNEKTAVEDLEKLRSEMVKQASELPQKRAEVRSNTERKGGERKGNRKEKPFHHHLGGKAAKKEQPARRGTQEVQVPCSKAWLRMGISAIADGQKRRHRVVYAYVKHGNSSGCPPQRCLH